MQRVVATPAAGLFVPTTGGDRVELAAGVGRFREAKGRSFATGTTSIGRALRSGAVQLRAESDPPDEMQIKLGGVVALAVPIVRNEIAVGVLGLAADPDRRFGARDVELLRRFASLVATALENARLQLESDARAVEMERLAHFDTLTDLPNRALFRDALRDHIAGARASGTRLAVLFIDVHHFKDLNDALGPRMGDALLRAIGPRLREALGTSTIARLAGDEFGVMASVADDEAGLRLARAAHDTFARPLSVDHQLLTARVSVGLALYPRDGDDVDTLLRRAEVAEQIAKRGEGWAGYAEQDDEYAPDRLALMAQLPRAIERDELVLHFQPIVEVRSRAIRGVEALVRWQHPERGMVPPLDFIPLAERSGLTKPLTVWVLREALRQLRRWRDGGLELSVAVNLSSRTLHDPELPGIVSDLIERAGVPPSLVGFEITETDVMADAEGAMRGLHALRDMGVRLSIDDFGTGYSSLAYLHRLAVDAVKIDRSFVKGINDDENSAAIVRATTELAHALGLRVVAEGVEDERALSRLASFSCDLAQGYHIARPMKAADVIPWLQGWRRALKT
jgi:diguanylate cyclase (GGDEF)-like protein